MKRLGVILLTAFAAALTTQARADNKAPAAADDKGTAEVLKADSAFTASIAKSDAKAFDGLTSDDYVLTTSLGAVRDKAHNLDSLKSGNLTFDKIDDEDQKAHLYGDVAVVTGMSKMKGKYKDKTFDDSYRWTRVWVHHDGSWKCVAEQISRVLNPDDLKPKDNK
jgi:ketosteroid isomerase-like protein